MRAQEALELPAQHPPKPSAPDPLLEPLPQSKSKEATSPVLDQPGLMPALKLAVGDGADDDAVDSRIICPITHEVQLPKGALTSYNMCMRGAMVWGAWHPQPRLPSMNAAKLSFMMAFESASSRQSGSKARHLHAMLTASI